MSFRQENAGDIVLIAVGVIVGVALGCSVGGVMGGVDVDSGAFDGGKSGVNKMGQGAGRSVDLRKILASRCCCC